MKTFHKTVRFSIANIDLEYFLLFGDNKKPTKSVYHKCVLDCLNNPLFITLIKENEKEYND